MKLESTSAMLTNNTWKAPSFAANSIPISQTPLLPTSKKWQLCRASAASGFNESHLLFAFATIPGPPLDERKHSATAQNCWMKSRQEYIATPRVSSTINYRLFVFVSIEWQLIQSNTSNSSFSRWGREWSANVQIDNWACMNKLSVIMKSRNFGLPLSGAFFLL